MKLFIPDSLQEIKKILQGLSGLKIVGADIVEVAPGEYIIIIILDCGVSLMCCG